MKICPVYGNEFVRDRPLWLFVALLGFFGLMMLGSILWMPNYQELMLEQQKVMMPQGGKGVDLEFMNAMSVYMDVVQKLFAIGTAFIFFGMAWMVTVKNQVSWWITIILLFWYLLLQGTSILGSMFFLLFSQMVQKWMPKGEVGWAYHPDLYLIQWGALGVGLLNVLILIVVIIWWWRRHQMHGVALKR